MILYIKSLFGHKTTNIQNKAKCLEGERLKSSKQKSQNIAVKQTKLKSTMPFEQ